MCDETRQAKPVDWGNLQNEFDYESGRITVTITLAEYRDLVSKAALYDASLKTGGAHAGA